jgi:hypothetical protein
MMIDSHQPTTHPHTLENCHQPNNNTNPNKSRGPSFACRIRYLTLVRPATRWATQSIPADHDYRYRGNAKGCDLHNNANKGKWDLMITHRYGNKYSCCSPLPLTFRRGEREYDQHIKITDTKCVLFVSFVQKSNSHIVCTGSSISGNTHSFFAALFSVSGT